MEDDLCSGCSLVCDSCFDVLVGAGQGNIPVRGSNLSKVSKAEIFMEDLGTEKLQARLVHDRQDGEECETSGTILHENMYTVARS